MPEVTVIIPAHNAGRTIDAALNSVLSQTFRDVDVIVMDDGSTDDTACRVATYRQRVTYCYQQRSGSVVALNSAVRLTRSPLIALLEPSSIWMPGKLERQIRYLRSAPDVALVCAGALSNETPSCTLRGSADISLSGDGVEAMSPARAAEQVATASISSLVFRRASIELLGTFDPSLPFAESVREFATRAVAAGTVGFQSIPLVVERTPERAAVPAPAGRGAINLLQDTRYRRARSRVTGVLHAADGWLTRRPGKPRRVLFEAASPMSLAVVGPVLRHLRRDPRLEFWFTSCDRAWTPHAIFGPSDITERVVTPDDVRWAKFDAYINTDFWDMTWLPRRTRRIHFFHGVAGKYGLDAPVKIAPVVATFDRLMFPNRDRLRRYAEAGLIDGDSPQAALIGYPKVDCLVDGSLKRTDTLARLVTDPKAPTVLYAPTWSPYSSLNTIGREVIAALGQLGVNVIVKLHDRSYDVTTRGSGGVDWRRSLRRVCERYGAHLVQDADASPWLHAADLLVTDHSSVGFEFMLLDRPIVVLDRPELIAHARVNPDKVTMLQNAASVVRAANEIGPAVRAALDHPAEHRSERRRIADELFFCPGSATTRAVEAVYELLAMPLPATAGVNAPAAPLPSLAPLVRSF
jgi:glycosyltransferase involved in cell wall biosynthesis